MTDRTVVLIVDDDEEIIDILKDHFKKRNCEAIATTDAATVVNKLRSFSVELMLLDLKMRKLDGFDVLDKIKKSGLPIPPTVIITGFLPKYQDKLKTYGIQMQDVVTKPFNFEVMEQAINRKLGAAILTAEVGSEYEDKIYEHNRCRIAFVEDEPDLLRHFEDFFKERKYKISCYSDGASALNGMQKNQVDIAVIDIKLPGGMNGDKLIEELCTLKLKSYMIPISADPLSKEAEKKLKDLGCHPPITKPFDIVELIELVKTLAIERHLLGLAQKGN